MPKFYKLNENWRFSLSDHPQAMSWNFDDCAFEAVTVPHDWSVKGYYDAKAVSGEPGGFLQYGTAGWYRRLIYIDQKKENQRFWLHFEGVLDNSTVYLNEEKVGSRPYGYFPAVYEITDYIREGANLLAVYVDCSRQPSTRWFNGAGIFRDVWLITAFENRIVPDGFFIRTEECSKQRAQLRVSAELELNQAVTAEVCLYFGGRMCSKVSKELPMGSAMLETGLTVEKPHLWSAETPELYQVYLRLISHGKLLDELHGDCGIRKLEFIPNIGLLVNGNPTKLKGVCLHHDVGVTGAAVAEETLCYRMELLKKMGCNALRTTHNPFSKSFYDLCDKLGFYVIDEAFDGWEAVKAKYDYGTIFAQYHKRDLTAFVRRDRNHPCVIMWSIGNEVKNITPETTRELMGIVKSSDTTRPVTCGIPGTGKESDECRAVLDIAGYNDGGGACFIYDRDHKARPDQLFVATESPHTLQTRGFYRTRTWWRDKNQPRKEVPNLTEKELFHDGCDIYTSSYDNAGVRLNARDCWNNTKSTPYIIGEFRWTGPDYYGESNCWPARARGYGVIDTANIPKDHYYLYQSMWVDCEKQPTLHILPHWTHSFPEGTVVPVFVYSNCETVELLLNGETLGSQPTKKTGYAVYRVPYFKGCLEAKGYCHGHCVAASERKTAGDAASLLLSHTYGNASEEQLCEIQTSVLDENGTEVPDAQNPVLFLGEGVRIAGTENGDPADLTPLVSHVRKTFYGKCMVLVRGIADQPFRRITAISLLGKRYFKDCVTVRIAEKSLTLSGCCPQRTFSYHYSVNGGPWQLYTGGIVLHDTADVRIRILENDRQTGILGATFIRGLAPTFDDVSHGNETIAGKKPSGPFAKQIVGSWRIVDDETVFRFKENGEVAIDTGTECAQSLGWWWYDFPTDCLETPDYAGTGEIWFPDGKKVTVLLTDLSAKMLKADHLQNIFPSVPKQKTSIYLQKL